MTKSEMLAALESDSSLRARHRYFASCEYLKTEDGKICTEDNYPINDKWWKERCSERWDKDWEVYKH